MNKNKAFTLIELIVVIAILAILAVALIPLINNFIEKSRISRFMTAISSLDSAGQAFNADTNTYPNLSFGVTFPVPVPATDLVINSNIAGWDGPYVNKNSVGLTPWGGVYQVGYASFVTFGAGQDDWVLFVFDEESSSGSSSGEAGSPSVPGASIKIIDNKIDGNSALFDGRVQGDPEGGSFGAVIIPAANSDGFEGEVRLPQGEGGIPQES